MPWDYSLDPPGCFYSLVFGGASQYSIRQERVSQDLLFVSCS